MPSLEPIYAEGILILDDQMVDLLQGPHRPLSWAVTSLCALGLTPLNVRSTFQSRFGGLSISMWHFCEVLIGIGAGFAGDIVRKHCVKIKRHTPAYISCINNSLQRGSLNSIKLTLSHSGLGTDSVNRSVN